MFKDKKTQENQNEKEIGLQNPSQFFIGLILLAVGLFMLSKRVIVHSGWFTWRIGTFDISSGMVVIPLIIGIIWYFYDAKSLGAKILMVLGGIFIVASIIMSVRITFQATSMFDYILIIVMIAAGAGVLLRAFFKKS